MSQDSKNSYLLCLDVGTTNSRCILFDTKGKSCCEIASKTDLKLMHPDNLFDILVSTMKRCIADSGLSFGDITSVGITGQRGTFLLWDRISGESRTPFNLWKDTAGIEPVTKAMNSSWTRRIINIYGNVGRLISRSHRSLALSSLTYHSKYTSIRLYNLLRENPELRQSMIDKRLLFGCLDTWLLWKLTKGRVFATECSCASSTALYDTFKNCWSDVLMWNLNIPRQILPFVMPTSGLFGEIDRSFLGGAIPIHCIIGDQQAALFGSGCFTPGRMKLTLGTGAFFDIQCGTTEAWVLQNEYEPLSAWNLSTNKATYYMAERNHPDFGTVIDWLIEEGYADDYMDMEKKLNSAHGQFDSSPVLFHPISHGYEKVFGECWVNRTPETSSLELLYTAMQGLAMIVKYIIMPSLSWLQNVQLDETETTKENTTTVEQKYLSVNGNASKSDWLMQEISDLLQMPLRRSHFSEVTAFGAAMLAALGAGIYSSLDEINLIIEDQIYGRNHNSTTVIFYPNKDRKEKLNERFSDWVEGWQQAVALSM